MHHCFCKTNLCLLLIKKKKTNLCLLLYISMNEKHLYIIDKKSNIYQLTVTTGCLQGHELTLRVLYRLYGEQVEDRDFFSSTNAASEYENFLFTVVCVLLPYFAHLSISKANIQQFFSQCRQKHLEILFHPRTNH